MALGATALGKRPTATPNKRVAERKAPGPERRQKRYKIKRCHGWRYTYKKDVVLMSIFKKVFK
ncbi:hypothetical protein [Pyrobaculum aerophilum]|uniref:hypothetical protein n=1 Tax=Pyrobaculum aerophilum TaxID=13773 RepID=UPI002FD954FD